MHSIEGSINFTKQFHHRWSTPQELDSALVLMRDVAESTLPYLEARARTLEAEANGRLIT